MKTGGVRRILLAALLSAQAFSLSAGGQRVRSIDVRLTLFPDGTARVCERWDLNTGSGITEWYLVRQNLGDIRIDSLSVTDETGRRFTDEGDWDVDRSLSAKAGRSGIVRKSDGVELCWGIGSYGDHVYEVGYSMTRAVKSLQDCDILHLQVVSPGMSSPPERASVTVEAPGFQLDTLHTRIWGFGFAGTSGFEDGKAVFSSSEAFGEDDSVIVLLRFDKGFFNSPSVQDRPFQEVLDRAMEGADFGDDEEEDPVASAIAFFFTGLFMYFIFFRPIIRLFREMFGLGPKVSRRKKRKILGMLPKNVPWYRDIPFGGGLPRAYTVLQDVGEEGKSNTLALAGILRLIHRGAITVLRDEPGAPVRLSCGTEEPKDLTLFETGLWQILREAAGKDNILEQKEFSSWAWWHREKIWRWMSSSLEGVHRAFKVQGLYDGKGYTAEGRKEARRLFGLRNFLKQFTLVNERETAETGIWKEYMVYAALFGCADRVSRQLKDIDPKFFQQTFSYESDMLPSLLTVGSAMASSIREAHRYGNPSYASSSGSSGGSSSSRGYGGSTSRGGGGGYSGGGRGGGGR